MADVSRIIYNPGIGNINLDLPEIAEFADWLPQDVRNDAKSDGGAYESSFRHSFDTVGLSLPFFPDPDFVDEFRSFWSWAKKGNTFTFIVDKTADGVNTTTTAPASAAQDIVSVVSNTGISVGQRLLLRNKTDFTDEIKVVESINVLDIKFDPNLFFPLNTGDIVRSPGFFTDMRIDPRTSGFPIIQEHGQAWTLRLNMVQEVN